MVRIETIKEPKKASTPEKATAADPKPKAKFDRNAYQRELMRKRRAKAKADRESK